MTLKDIIIERLQKTFPTGKITVETPDNVHFTAKVVAKEFKGLSRVAQQQKVYAPLNDLLASGELHALALQTQVLEDE